MHNELHKRLEEAADNYIGHPREIDEGLDIYICRKAYKEGAEYGYKEGLEVGKSIAKQKFQKYLENLIPVYQEQATCFKKDVVKYNNPIERIIMSSEVNGKLNLINKIINKFFKENNESKNN